MAFSFFFLLAQVNDFFSFPCSSSLLLSYLYLVSFSLHSLISLYFSFSLPILFLADIKERERENEARSSRVVTVIGIVEVVL